MFCGIDSVSLGGMKNFKKKFNIALNDKQRLQKLGLKNAKRGNSTKM